MKKTLLIVLISIVGIAGYAQTPAEKAEIARQKKAAETDLNNIKRLYDRLKGYKIDTKTELLWEYTYEDSTETQLKNLAQTLEKEGLKAGEITPSKSAKKTFTLALTEVKKYAKPEELNERVNHLNEIALGYHITTPYASIGAEKQKAEGGIGTYKKVGKQK